MINDFKGTGAKWAAEWTGRHFRNQFVLTILFVIGANLLSFYCFIQMGNRAGIQLHDYFHLVLKPYDFSLPLFILIYFSVFLAFTFLIPHPKKLLMGLQAFSIIALMRTLSIYLIPLSPPSEMIVLHDPVAEFFLKRGDVMVTNDLFFSGHVAFGMLLYFTAQNTFIKRFCAATTFIIGILIVWQHVHYTIDVVSAPFFAYGAVKLVEYLHHTYEHGFDMAFNNQD
jgi:signal transduction histidine kinase